MNALRVGLRVIRKRGYTSPFATNLSLVAIPIGLLAAVLGPKVSVAFGIVLHRPELIYVWGTVLLAGGVNVAVGILRRVPSIERAGLYVLFFPWAFYGVVVLIGLGRGGLVAGPTSIVIALSCLLRARSILTAARHLSENASNTEDWATRQLAGTQDD